VCEAHQLYYEPQSKWVEIAPIYFQRRGLIKQKNMPSVTT
jgi:hypothetical protein